MAAKLQNTEFGKQCGTLAGKWKVALVTQSCLTSLLKCASLWVSNQGRSKSLFKHFTTCYRIPHPCPAQRWEKMVSVGIGHALESQSILLLAAPINLLDEIH